MRGRLDVTARVDEDVLRLGHEVARQRSGALAGLRRDEPAAQGEPSEPGHDPDQGRGYVVVNGAFLRPFGVVATITFATVVEKVESD